MLQENTRINFEKGCITVLIILGKSYFQLGIRFLIGTPLATLAHSWLQHA